MGTTHIVEHGQHLSELAEQYGFHSWETIWDCPENAELKRRREAHVLYPGDKVFIPDKKQKTESRPTGREHTFRVRSQPLKLRIALTDFDNRPLPGMPCELEIEGKIFPATSDGKGIVEVAIPKNAHSGVLRVADLDLVMPLQIGHLDPADEESGWKARLINLGYYTGPEGDLDDDYLRKAWEEFQRDQDMTVSGEPNGATRAKLKAVHGI